MNDIANIPNNNKAAKGGDSKDSISGEYTTLNLGPTHPATHGIFQNVLQMDGEKLNRSMPNLDKS